MLSEQNKDSKDVGSNVDSTKDKFNEEHLLKDDFLVNSQKMTEEKLQIPIKKKSSIVDDIDINYGQIAPGIKQNSKHDSK